MCSPLCDWAVKSNTAIQGGVENSHFVRMDNSRWIQPDHLLLSDHVYDVLAEVGCAKLEGDDELNKPKHMRIK